MSTEVVRLRRYSHKNNYYMQYIRRLILPVMPVMPELLRKIINFFPPIHACNIIEYRYDRYT